MNFLGLKFILNLHCTNQNDVNLSELMTDIQNVFGCPWNTFGVLPSSFRERHMDFPD